MFQSLFFAQLGVAVSLDGSGPETADLERQKSLPPLVDDDSIPELVFIVPGVAPLQLAQSPPPFTPAPEVQSPREAAPRESQSRASLSSECGRILFGCVCLTLFL